LEQKTAQEVIADGLVDVPCSKPVEELDSLVDCTRVEAEIGWRQPQSMKESFEAYGTLKVVRPY